MGGATLRYEFPWPPRALSPNVSVHWRTLAKAKAQYKEHCGWLIVEPRHFADARRHYPLKLPVTAQVTFVVPDKRRRDTDNHLTMLKPCFDALVGMGILEDDSHDKLRILEPKWERGEKKVIVELSPYGGD